MLTVSRYAYRDRSCSCSVNRNLIVILSTRQRFLPTARGVTLYGGPLLCVGCRSNVFGSPYYCGRTYRYMPVLLNYRQALIPLPRGGRFFLAMLHYLSSAFPAVYVYLLLICLCCCRDVASPRLIEPPLPNSAFWLAACRRRAVTAPMTRYKHSSLLNMLFTATTDLQEHSGYHNHLTCLPTPLLFC